MKAIWKVFFIYSLVGLANTLIHWQVFFVLRMAADLDQSISNFAAFCVAAPFSFYGNALYTFDAKLSVMGCVLFLSIMGALSYVVGYLGDCWHLHGLLTVATFSVLSLVIGFVFFRFLVFYGHRT